MSIQQGSVGGMPVLILKEGATQTIGRDAQKNNMLLKLVSSGIVSRLKLRPTRHGQDVGRFSR